MNAIDFFCGGGGTTRGLLDAGINVILGLDNNPACQNTYQNNNNVPYLCGDIQNITAAQLLVAYPLLQNNDELLMVGCAPCQPFSSQRKSPTEHISRNLLDEFGRLVQEILPAHILIENVPLIKKRGEDVLQRFIQLITELGYLYDTKTVNAKDYGVPQNRKRYVLIASRYFEPHIPPATHGNGEGLIAYATVENAIGHFPPIAAGEQHPEIPNHISSEVSDLNLARLQATPHNGGDRRAWPENLRLNCHNNYNGHTDVYGRMFWNRVAPTLTSKCYSISNGRFGHPEQDRAISFREAAAIQSFPDTYVFEGGFVEMGRQIGNAVPVLLAQAMGSYILDMHNAHN